MKRTTLTLLSITILALASATASAGGHGRGHGGHGGYHGGHHSGHVDRHYRGYSTHKPRHHRRHYDGGYWSQNRYYGPRHGYRYYSGPRYGFGFAVNYRPVYGSYYRRVSNDWYCPGAESFVVERTYYYRTWDKRHDHYHYGY